tara:strand:- start:385 stop:1620 length:1236 start_codon:yes stop_codon:yes gene_type:complete
MQFSYDSSIIIKNLLPKIPISNNPNIKLSKNSKILQLLYNDINDGYNYYIKNVENISTKIINNFDLIYPEGYHSSRYSKEIKLYINNNINEQLLYKFNIFDRKIKVYFALFSVDSNSNIDFDKYNEYIKNIIMWLHICNKYSTQKCSNTLNIFFYLTPFKKVLPNNNSEIIGHKHVNTGMTYRCTFNNEIFIYRNEEWFKVLIHECFHSYGLDINTNDNNILKEKIMKIFPINSSFNIAETYTEIWARILNSSFCSYISSNNEDDFELFLNFSLQIERLYSIMQLNKILEFMNLEYRNLWDNDDISKKLRNILFKEESNAFCYYILSAVLMNEYVYFLSWCYKNNTSIIKYQPHTNNNKFISMIKELYKKEELMKEIDNFKKKRNRNKITSTDKDFILKTTRMSAIDLKLI